LVAAARGTRTGYHTAALFIHVTVPFCACVGLTTFTAVLRGYYAFWVWFGCRCLAFGSLHVVHPHVWFTALIDYVLYCVIDWRTDLHARSRVYVVAFTFTHAFYAHTICAPLVTRFRLIGSRTLPGLLVCHVPVAVPHVYVH